MYAELIVIEGVTESHEERLHPDDVISRKKPNSTNDESLSGALVIRTH